ncbi:MAG: hypothetical protein UR87_C0018G0011 [candidate division CPR3 bacterium GW2011_GWE2_35_7]|uniref:Uncharacterized protein n=1 Tax=candidate division CPR3 bacterium GW2011_GWF2_35_18 TaxID=1618350 RepID=A0A0G0E4W9_UNCC3|nr:MAG: hypothetical protein UR67_C0001G0289 [candidate division CPR3 bacterium GW2011_GWF2_35_18]KKP86482.1 MAG: hypothetical protein UR87_C0018G0011 [candidate division CPR3 bacterium GW2011_GWE2_35_7]
MFKKKAVSKKLTPKTVNSGPIDLPTRTLILLGILLAIVGLTMVFYPEFWFA